MALTDLLKNESVCEEKVYSPMNGKSIPLCNIDDPVFSQEMLGQGVAVEPSEGRVVAPVDGIITMGFDFKHAIALETSSNLEILIHVGIDTVKLEGQFFHVYVKPGDKVKVGDLLAEFDLEQIKNAGYRAVTPIIISNTDQYREIRVVKTGKIKEKEVLLNVFN